MRPLLWPYIVSRMYKDYVYTNILMYVNTSVFCANKHIFVSCTPKNFCFYIYLFLLLFGHIWNFGYYSVHHFREQLSLKLAVFTMLQPFVGFSVTFLTKVCCNLHPYFQNTCELQFGCRDMFCSVYS